MIESSVEEFGREAVEEFHRPDLAVVQVRGAIADNAAVSGASFTELMLGFRSPVSMCIIDPLRRVVIACNEAAANLYSRTVESCSELPLGELFAVGELERIERAMADDPTEGLSAFSCLQARPCGETFLSQIYLHPASLADTTVWLMTILDDTQNGYIEELRQVEDRLREWQERADIVVHDTNNLLLVALVGAQEIQTSPYANSLGVNPRLVESAVVRAASLLRQLVSTSTQQAATLQYVDLNQLIQNLRPILEQIARSGVRLEHAFCIGTPIVLIEPTLMEQVIVNLALNACRAMPKGGVLRLATETCNDPGSGLPSVLLEVRDSGIGIREELLATLFEPHVTTRSEPSGHGIGLASCKATVEKFGGRIAVESVVDEGACFRIWLPALDRELVDTRAIGPEE